MKRCPQCNNSYTDDHLNYCLADGTRLTIESEQITVERTDEKTIVKQTSPSPKKGKFLLWLGLSGLAIFVGSGVIAGLLIYKYSGQGESSSGDRQKGVNLSPSPTLQTTPRVTPTTTLANSSPVEESSPKIEGSKPTPNKQD